MIRMCRMIRRVLGHLTPIDWAAVSMKLALGVAWPFFYFSGSPVRLDGFDNALLGAWCLCVIVGFVVSLAGLIAAAQPRRFRYSGRQIEMAGIWLLLGAPLCYGILQAGLWEETGNPIRGAQVALAWAIGSALVLRLLIVKRDGVLQAARRTEEGS